MDDLKKVFVDELGIDEASFSEELSYNSISEWDSASHMVIIVSLEQRYDVSFDSDEIIEATSVAKLRDILRTKGVHIEP
jgi:acyl carrier protein